RAGLAVAGNRAVDQPWIDRRRARVIEPELREAAWAEILDQDVGRLNQLPQRSRTGGGLQIERDAFLAPVQLEEKAAAAVDERAPAARVVSMFRFFDLEHLGAHVAEHHRAERTRDDTREIDHAQTIKWRHAQIKSRDRAQHIV